MPEPAALSDADARAIAETALPHCGLQPERMELVSRSENIVFRLETPNGAHALRLHRPGYHTLAELESELQWTRALNAAGVQAPVGRLTRDGRGYVTLATPDGSQSRAVGRAGGGRGLGRGLGFGGARIPARVGDRPAAAPSGPVRSPLSIALQWRGG